VPKTGSGRVRGQGNPASTQIEIIGLDQQIELEVLRLREVPRDVDAGVGDHLDLPNLDACATIKIDVAVPGARRGDFADAAVDTSSVAFVLDCHVWSNNSVRVTAWNVSASMVDLAAALLSLQVVKRRVPQCEE
jgi:hypothetical protein